MNHAAHYRISLLHGKIAVFTKSSIRSTYVPGSLWDSRHPHVGHGKMPMFLGEVLPSPSLNQATRGLRRAVVDAVPSTKSKNASASGGQEEYTVPLKRMIKCSTIAASHATGFRDTGNGRNGRGNEMYRLVGRDVPGALRAWGRHRDAHGDASGTRAAGDVGPYHGCPVNTMRPCQPRCVRTCHLVGRDVPGAPRAWGRYRDANGNASGTRAAGDVGPYHGCPVNTMRPCRACRLVGRDVLGAPRAWGRHRDGDAIGNTIGTRAAGDVGPYHGCPVNTMRPCRPRCAQTCHLVGRDVLGAPRAWGRQRNTHGDAHGNANGTRAVGDVGPYQAISCHSWAYLLPPATVSRSSFR